MDNIIDQKPIGEVILNENTPNRSPRFEHYLIPYYQRGYRWESEHVEALLNDIDNFRLSGEEKYCLQPIVVAEREDNEGHRIWEVIDGQQRLITMNIIFNYIKKPTYSIIFENRGKSTEFLKNLSEDTYNHDDPDFHFMSRAHQTIKKWIDEKQKNVVSFIDRLNITITDKVELIWYQIEELKDMSDEKEIEEKKINIFNRLNIGKIPLTDAELIRALLLSKIKLGLSSEEAILRQSEISNDWNRMELELRNERFWALINNTSLNEVSSTVEYLFNLIVGSNPKRYSTYLWFEKEIQNSDPIKEREKAQELWKKTKDVFGVLKYWYNDKCLYHHIGYLVSLEDDSLKVIKDLKKLSDNATKSKFKKIVLVKVRNSVSNLELDKLSYEENYNELFKILFLYNVLLVENSKVDDYNRFPFHLFTQTKRERNWSIEHIHAQKSEDMKDQNAIRKWLEDTKEVVKGLTVINDKNKEYNIDNFNRHIDELLSQKPIDVIQFNNLKSRLIESFESKSIHVLDNLALLSSNHNSSLNNSIFLVKRNKILQLDKEGKYIPMGTKNVFTKYYTSSDLQPYYWSEEDKEHYFNDIQEKLSPYLNKNNRQNEK